MDLGVFILVITDCVLPLAALLGVFCLWRSEYLASTLDWYRHRQWRQRQVDALNIPAFQNRVSDLILTDAGGLTFRHTYQFDPTDKGGIVTHYIPPTEIIKAFRLLKDLHNLDPGFDQEETTPTKSFSPEVAVPGRPSHRSPPPKGVAILHTSSEGSIADGPYGVVSRVRTSMGEVGITPFHVWNALKQTGKHIYMMTEKNGIRVNTNLTGNYPVTVCGTSPEDQLDFVMLRIPPAAWALASVNILKLSRAPLRKGDPLTISTPNENGGWTSSTGLITGAGRLFRPEHDASTSPGASGAPVYDNMGRFYGFHAGSVNGRGVPVNYMVYIARILSVLDRKPSALTALAKKYKPESTAPGQDFYNEVDPNIEPREDEWYDALRERINSIIGSENTYRNSDEYFDAFDNFDSMLEDLTSHARLSYDEAFEQLADAYESRSRAHFEQNEGGIASLEFLDYDGHYSVIRGSVEDEEEAQFLARGFGPLIDFRKEVFKMPSLPDFRRGVENPLRKLSARLFPERNSSPDSEAPQEMKCHGCAHVTPKSNPVTAGISQSEQLKSKCTPAQEGKELEKRQEQKPIESPDSKSGNIRPEVSKPLKHPSSAKPPGGRRGKNRRKRRKRGSKNASSKSTPTPNPQQASKKA